MRVDTPITATASLPQQAVPLGVDSSQSRVAKRMEQTEWGSWCPNPHLVGGVQGHHDQANTGGQQAPHVTRARGVPERVPLCSLGGQSGHVQKAEWCRVALTGICMRCDMSCTWLGFGVTYACGRLVICKGQPPASVMWLPLSRCRHVHGDCVLHPPAVPSAGPASGDVPGTTLPGTIRAPPIHQTSAMRDARPAPCSARAPGC